MKHMSKVGRITALIISLCVICSIQSVSASASESGEFVPEIGGESTGITAAGEERPDFRSPTGSIGDFSSGTGYTELSEDFEYPVAPNGMTYGNWGQFQTAGEYPDLVYVYATNGKSGYVKLEDFEPVLYLVKSGASAEEINAYIKSIEGIHEERIIPVYDLNMNVIGEFSCGYSDYSDYSDILRIVEGIETTPASDTEVTGSQPKNSFTDVAETSPFYDAIMWAVGQNITNGTTATTFSPNNTCSVSNILTFLWRANNRPDEITGAADRDSAAAWAIKQGIIKEDIDVGDPCTRAMAVTFMWNVAGSPETKTQVNFSDVDANANYLSAVAWALKRGITTGTSETTFSPESTCTRGQIVTFLYRGLAG